MQKSEASECGLESTVADAKNIIDQSWYIVFFA